MKLVINISEKDLYALGELFPLSYKKIFDEGAVFLPKGVTNGEVIRTLFPQDIRKAIGQDEEWWNAPYKENTHENTNRNTR